MKQSGMYKELREDYFDFLSERSRNPVRKWFHATRFKVAMDLVQEYYKKGMVIVDLGCGSCNWNEAKLPVIGIDSEREVLDYALKMQRIKKAYAKNINNTGIRAESVDIVTLFGVLEHVPNYRDTLTEAHKILKKGGVIISTVPYDTLFSLWKHLFAMHCFFQGTLLRKPYFKNKAGHINSFSPASIASEYKSAGFEVIKQFNKVRMEIYTVGKKH